MNLTRHHIKYLLIRSLAGSIGLLFVCLGIMTLTLTAFSILLNCAPFFTAILAHFFIGDSIGWYDVVAMVGSFVGIVLIAMADPDETSVAVEMFPGWTVKGTYMFGVSCTLVSAMIFSVWVSKALRWNY